MKPEVEVRIAGTVSDIGGGGVNGMPVMMMHADLRVKLHELTLEQRHVSQSGQRCDLGLHLDVHTHRRLPQTHHLSDTAHAPKEE